MNQSIGNVALYNIIVVFLVITFSFLAGTISYSKAFRVNSKIINAVEEYEGYNTLSSTAIDKALGNIGYRLTTSSNKSSCPKRGNSDAYQKIGDKYAYCIYEFADADGYYHWGVTTYIFLDIPVVGDMIEIPIYSTSDSYYRFPLVAPSTDDSNL